MGARQRAGEKSQHRKLQRELTANKKTFSRRKAEKLIARLSTVAELEGDARLSAHKNKHVKAKLAHKVAKLRTA